jgi:hypothetical protein
LPRQLGVDRREGAVARVKAQSEKELLESYRVKERMAQERIKTERKEWNRAQVRKRKRIQEQSSVEVNAAYKSKAKKVVPVDFGDGMGEKPGGREDWYERSKLRDTKQQQKGQFQEYLIPRFCDIPRGSRLTLERVAKLDIGTELWPREMEMFLEMMTNREKVIAFDWMECGRIHEDVTPPIEIKTIPHTAWQAPNFPCPKSLLPVAHKMLKERLERGVLERCFGPYRNPWFLVGKKEKNAYRLINAAMAINKVTIRDANLPPSVDEFSEEFAGCSVASLVDFFSGYDQLTLAEKSRDLTAFYTPGLGLLRQTTLLQGATNSVAVFCRVAAKILEELYPHISMPFLDDIRVKGPYSTYDNVEILPRVY